MILISVLWVLASAQVSAAKPPDTEEFYSVASVLKSLTPKDMENHRLLSIPPPPVLFHWLTIRSLKKLLPKKLKEGERIPLKSLGSLEYGSLLVRGARAFRDVPGLYAWHNPVGATVGGSNEIYGNREAVLAMRIDPKVKIGLIFTKFGSQPQALSDPSLKSRYDLILHLTGGFYPDGFTAGIIEWAILNPRSVVAVTADPVEIGSIMKTYEDALEKLKQYESSEIPPMQRLAGPQHSPFTVFTLNKKRISQWREGILANRERLPRWLIKGWVPVGSGACFDKARNTPATSDADF